jgi:SAM-dependent methyltransferase
VVGIDVNLQYLAVARQRHMRLGPLLELYCQEAERARLPAEGFDLVWAGLFLEHVDVREVLPRIATWLAPGGSLVAALQLPSAAGAPAASPPGPVRAVAAAMRLVPPGELAGTLAAAGLLPRQAYLLEIARGARLHVCRWVKPK